MIGLGLAAAAVWLIWGPEKVWLNRGAQIETFIRGRYR